jgi:hypothetical protein
MAAFYAVDIAQVAIYTKYFDVTIVPSLLFFYNGQHIKCDYGYVLMVHQEPQQRANTC